MKCMCGEQELAETEELMDKDVLHRRWGPCYIPQANLGVATTEELVNELVARFTLNWRGGAEQLQQMDRVVILAKFLGGLTALEKEYRTVDERKE